MIVLKTYVRCNGIFSKVIVGEQIYQEELTVKEHKAKVWTISSFSLLMWDHQSEICFVYWPVLLYLKLIRWFQECKSSVSSTMRREGGERGNSEKLSVSGTSELYVEGDQ